MIFEVNISSATFIMFTGDFAETFDNELIAKLGDDDILGE